MTEKNRFDKYLEKQKEKAENEGKTNVKPWDLLNPNAEYVDKETAEARFNICKTCPELFQMTKQCKKCGCFMYAKTKLQKATCPLGKW